MLLIETAHSDSGEIVEYMESKGYRKERELKYDIVFVYDKI